MTKKTYATPVADLLKFDYKETIVASLTDEEAGVDASHCFYGRNQGQCASKNKNKCGTSSTPGTCT